MPTVTAPRLASRGQGLVEFALVAPLFILIIVGIFDVGRLVWFQNEIRNLATQAVRQAAVSLPGPPCVGLTNTACANAIVASQQIGFAASKVEITCTDESGGVIGTADTCQLGRTLNVRIEVEWQAITPIIGSIIGPVTISSFATQAVE